MRIVDTVCLLCKSDVILCSVKIESWSASSLVFVVSDHLACCHLLIEVNCVVVSSGIQMVSWFVCISSCVQDVHVHAHTNERMSCTARSVI